MWAIRGVACITSDRSVSLQNVCRSILRVFVENGVRDARLVKSAVATPRYYRGIRLAITVMTFDPAWVVPYFYVSRMLRTRGATSIFYTTTEGRVNMPLHYSWVVRDLVFIANSEYTAEKLREIPIPVRRVVPHGVDTRRIARLAPRGRYLRERMGIGQDDKLVLYIAGCYMRKGHDLFSQVAKTLSKNRKDIKILVVTKGECVKYYKGIPTVYVIESFGEEPEDNILSLYHAADIYAQASLSEGFGLPVLEALAAGKLVVHPDYAPLTEITTPETSVRVQVVETRYRQELGSIDYELHFYDPKEFAQAIEEALDMVSREPDYYREKCIERAKALDIRKTYKFFLDVYKHGERLLVPE